MYYFPTRAAATRFANERNYPVDRIQEYGRGWTIQGGVSGDYAGPHGLKIGDWQLQKNPASRHESEIDAAAKLQSDFSGHEPGNVDAMTVPENKVFTPVGNLAGVLYDTTRDGNDEKYIHRFRRKSRPLLLASHDGTELRIAGGRFRFTEAGIVDE